MAKIVLGVWTTHGPTLNTQPELWGNRVVADRKRQHWYKSSTYSFDELVTLRKDENLEFKSSLPERAKNHAACQQAIAVLAEKWQQAAPDVCVILGNDQRELMLEQLRPAFTVYTGDTFFHQPMTEEQVEQLPPGIKETEWAYRPEEYTQYPGLPDLGVNLVELGMERGFDFAISEHWPQMDPTHWHEGAPHAFGWVFRRVMNDKVVPTLPVITNTFFPPNQPRAKRCFELGQLVAEAINSWDKDLRVAVIGSGGMSHFVINEDFDRMFMQALQNRDTETLKAIDSSLLKDGTSEMMNWISTAGALYSTDLSGDIIDYVPCYRSEAGTGTANGFVCWT